MHVIQVAFAFLASGASVLIVTAMVIESLHDKKHLQDLSVDLHDQPSAPAPALEHPADPARAAQPQSPQSEPPKNTETDVAGPVSRDRDRRRKKERITDDEERKTRKRRREAKRQERGEQPRRRRRGADSDLSAEAQEG